MKSIILLIVCCIFCVQSSSHKDTSQDAKAKIVRRIVGGEEISIEDRPFMVSIQLDSRHACGGSIISPKLVLTAAHCLPEEPKHYTVRSGSTYHNKGGTVHRIRQVIKHSFGDIALLEVCEPFEIDNVTCAPIEIFKHEEKSEDGTWATVSGWGLTVEGRTCIPDKLRKVSLPIIDRKLCSSSYRSSCNVTVGQLCAGFFGQGGKDACHGDSGGPLTIDGKLAGIVSRGKGCGRPNFPGIYTEVAFHEKWINKQIWLMKADKKTLKCSL